MQSLYVEILIAVFFLLVTCEARRPHYFIIIATVLLIYLGPVYRKRIK
jgi:hypothetical protein